MSTSCTRKGFYTMVHPRSSAIAALLLLLTVVGCRTGQKLPCSYWARETATNPTPQLQELQPRGVCAILPADGRLSVYNDHLNELYFSDGLASVHTPNGWYYVTSAGHTAPVVTFDNGPDYFSEGLARTTRSGKIGFIDRSLSEVIPPSWDFAFPFDGGVAVVCQGCRPHAIHHGEHHEMRGGVWGYVDRAGTEIVPVRFERDQVPAPSRRSPAG